MKTKRSCQLKKFSLITCKLAMRKKLVDSKNLNKKVVFINIGIFTYHRTKLSLIPDSFFQGQFTE